MAISDVTALLDVCAREPIHIPGSIQPYGVLVCVDVPSLTIRNVSANAGAVFDCAPTLLIARPLTAFVQADAAALLRDYLAQPGLKEAAPHPLEIISAAGNVRSWTVYAHATDDGCILELEHEVEAGTIARALATLHQQVRVAVRSVQAATSLQQLAEVTAQHVRHITGFDRVMIYQFTEAWHGHVVAESRADSMHAYLNHYFPSSDIPPQARAVFLDNWLRMIPDVNYDAVPLVPPENFHDGSPLNLGQAGLRSVSPVHIEYLRNMGVAATLTMPLISEGKLWGLVACHHATPRLIDVDYRLAAILVAQLVSSQIAVKTNMEDQRYQSQLADTHQRLIALMEREENLVDGLVKFAPTMLDIAGASGAAAAVYFDNSWTIIGATPSIADIERLVDWLIAEHHDEDIFATNCLSHLFAPAAAYKDKASGLIAVSIPKSPRNFILWFRPEVATEVTWAGPPAKRIELDGDTWRLHPRFSFEAWVEVVEGRAAPWRKVELAAVTDLRNSILALDLQRAFSKEQAARALAEKLNAEYQGMVHIVSHDIRNPLGVIKMSLQMLNMDRPLDSEQQKKLLGRSLRSAEVIERLVTSVLDVARLETEPLNVDEQLDVQVALADVVELLQPLAERAGIALRLDCPPPPARIAFGQSQFEQVIGNLVSNALKFTPRGGAVNVTSKTDANETTIIVTDTGSGIDAAVLPKVFERFVRGEHHAGQGAGLGLAIVRETVERYGGTVAASSAPGSGATISITLPLVATVP